jgi:hypothetical protein
LLGLYTSAAVGRTTTIPPSLGKTVIAASIIAVYLAIGLAPFRWNPPRWLHNGADYRDGAVQFLKPGLIQIRRQYAQLPTGPDDQLRIRLRVKPANSSQSGPARIFTISHNTWSRNLTIGQQKDNLVVRVRTLSTNFNGIPDHTLPDVFKAGQSRDIEVAIHSNELHVLIDGVKAATEPLPPGSLKTWDTLCPVALGNEPTWDRPWLGEIALARLITPRYELDCLRQDISFRPHWLIPDGKFKVLGLGPYLNGQPQLLRDAALNLLLFVPLGLALVLLNRQPSLLSVLGICLSLSLCIELAQIGIDGRFPSLADWLTNAAGGWLGSVLGMRLPHKSAAGHVLPVRTQ